MHRLSAAGGPGAADALLALPAAGGAPPGLLLPAAAAAAPQASGASGSASEAEVWQAEKRLLKAICKLALAVTMDQVGGAAGSRGRDSLLGCLAHAAAFAGHFLAPLCTAALTQPIRITRPTCASAGRQEAASLARELSPLMGSHTAALHQLGLHKVWASLQKLALAGAAPSRAASQAAAHEAAAAAALEPAAGVQQQQQRAQPEEDVVALQQRVAAYKAKCRELKASVVWVDGWVGGPQLSPAVCKSCVPSEPTPHRVPPSAHPPTHPPHPVTPAGHSGVNGRCCGALARAGGRGGERAGAAALPPGRPAVGEGVGCRWAAQVAGRRQLGAALLSGAMGCGGASSQRGHSPAGCSTLSTHPPTPLHPLQEVKWVLEDYSDCEAALAGGAG